jgi:hypothetical protein
VGCYQDSNCFPWILGKWVSLFGLGSLLTVCLLRKWSRREGKLNVFYFMNWVWHLLFCGKLGTFSLFQGGKKWNLLNILLGYCHLWQYPTTKLVVDPFMPQLVAHFKALLAPPC